MDHADPFADIDSDIEEPAPMAVKHGEASVQCEVYGCAIKFYFSDERFEAVCDNPAHATATCRKCRLSRYLPDAASAGAHTRGRCIGLFAKILQVSFDPRFETGTMHRNHFRLKTFKCQDHKPCRGEVRKSLGGDVVVM